MSTERKIAEWAKDKGILDRATPKDQFVKMVEEVGEIAECLSKDRPLKEFELEMGDLMVTAIILSELMDTNINRCMYMAYNKIAGRTGRMNAFTKEQREGLKIFVNAIERSQKRLMGALLKIE